jgi:uncharacterized protein YebE (UPF0316 family)
MSNIEIFICLAVMFFIGYLVGRRIERRLALIAMDQLHKEIVDVIEKHKNHREKMFQELDKFIAEYEAKEDSDD